MKVFLCMAVIFLSTNVHAASFSVSGEVKTIGVNSYDLWGEDTSYFILDGVAPVGGCRASGDEMIIRVLGDEGGDRQLSVLLAAQMSGTPVFASVDDTRRDNSGNCIVRWVQLRK